MRLKDLKGMRYLERMLAEPGREFHVLDLVSVERGALPANTSLDAARIDAQCGLEVFDSKAREAYRQRLTEVEEDIAEAESQNDFRRAELARADREFLVDELRRGVGLNNRARMVGDGVERARTGATRSLRYAINRIARHHPVLASTSRGPYAPVSTLPMNLILARPCIGRREPVPVRTEAEDRSRHRSIFSIWRLIRNWNTSVLFRSDS